MELWIAWRTVSEMTYNVSSGTFSLTHSLTHSPYLTSGVSYSLSTEVTMHMTDVR